MHVTAARPSWVSRVDVPAEVVDKEREIYREQMAASGKPPQVVEKIIDGKLDKFYTESCLLEQAYIKDPNVTIQDLLTSNIAALGENIKVRRFARLEIGG